MGGSIVKFAENPFHLIPGGVENIIQRVAPIALSVAGQPELAAAYTAANNYGNGGSLGKSLLNGGLNYAGSQIGSELAGGDSVFNGLGKNLGLDGIGNSISSGLSDVKNSLGFGSSGNILSSSAPSTGIFDSGTGGASSAYSPTSSASSFDDVSSALDSKDPFQLSGSTASNAVSSTPSIGSNVASKTGNLFNQSNLTPLLSLGSGAFSNISAKNDLLGAAKKNSALFAPYLNAQFNPGDLTQDPGYQFNLSQGQQALDRKQAATGNYFSGNALKEAQTFGQGLADSTYNQAYQRFLSGNAQNLQAASAQAGINNDVANAKVGSATGLGNLFSSSAAGLFGGNAYGSNGQQLNQSQYGNIFSDPDYLKYLQTQRG